MLLPSWLITDPQPSGDLTGLITTSPIRAPVLTLRAAVVAERLGHGPDTALTLGCYVAGSRVRGSIH